MNSVLNQVRNCIICKSHLSHSPNPILAAGRKSKIVIIGQAPGSKVHQSGIAWNDQSGKLLREWMGIESDIFYNPDKVALIPMGFCYPGKGKSGDLPPRSECAPEWHAKLLNKMSDVKIIILIGQYSQKYYLQEKAKKNLTETVRNFEKYLPNYFPLPHPSPRNRFWLKKNPWFHSILLPRFKKLISEYID